MKRALLAIALMFPALVHAQVPPSRWSQNYVPTLSDWKAALTYNGKAIPQALDGKVASQGGTCTECTISGGSVSGTAVVGGSATGTDTSNALATATGITWNASQGSGQIATITASMSRTPAERALTLPQPQDFLSSGQTPTQLVTGQIDIGPILNTMIVQGVIGIDLPCGLYKLKTKVVLANNVSITGHGACTVISVQDNTDDIFYGGNVQFTEISHLIIRADVTRTSGAAITYYNSFENRIHDVLFTNGVGEHWTDIFLSGANATHIDRVAGRGGGWNGITLTGTTLRTVDTYINASGFDGYGNAAIEFQWASGTYMSGMDLLGGKTAGVLIDPVYPQEVDGLRATSVLADSNQGPGWALVGNGAITEFNITNCWGSTNGYVEGTLTYSAASQGFFIGNVNANNITVAHSEFHNNTAEGVSIANGTHISVVGNMVFMNSGAGIAKFPGIRVGASPNFLIVANNMSGAGGEAQNTHGGTSQSAQSYGIISELPAVDTGHYALFLGNVASGNQTGNFNIPTATAAPNIVSSNNVGF